jgi:hypothetical protein
VPVPSSGFAEFHFIDRDGASVGTYLVLAACNRLVAPRSKRGFADWWKTTAADRFTRIRAAALDHRKFWEAMHAVTAEQLVTIEHRLVLGMIEAFGLCRVTAPWLCWCGPG